MDLDRGAEGDGRVSSSAGRAGASAYAALVEWENAGRLAGLAPGLADRIAVAEASAGALARYRAALDRLIAADQEPAAAMAAGVRFVDAARARVAPSTWWEALVVTVVWVPLVDVLAASAEPAGYGPAGSVAAESAVGPADPDRNGWAVWRVREAIEADPVLGARLVLWGRRLGGEAVALAADFTGPVLAPDLAPAPEHPAPTGLTGGPRDTVPGKGVADSIVAGQKDRATAFAELADQIAKAHAAALVPLFGQQEQRPAGR